MERHCNRVLFINTNRYLHPPVMPLAAEYLIHALKSHDFDVHFLDLCFSGDPLQDLEQSLKNFQPDAVCMTIRNVDSALYPETDYFLPEIKGYIEKVKATKDLPVVIGGSAVSADPEGVLKFVGANIAIQGPGETTLPEVLSDENIFKEKGRVIQGKLPQSCCPNRDKAHLSSDYLDRGGLPGFETHKGCSSHCVYCIEAETPVVFRNPSDVICEIQQLTRQDLNHLHLCDSEFNENLDYCLDLLQRMDREKLGMTWALYMKPGNCNAKLFELLRLSGAYLVTLSVDTFQRDHAYWREVESAVSLCKKNGIRISIDFLTGFPYEDAEKLKRSLDFFRRIAPDEVVVNVSLRLYKNTGISHRTLSDPSLKQYLIVPERSDGSMLSPIFYNHVPIEKLREHVDRDPLFRIAGQEKVVNYQKA